MNLLVCAVSGGVFSPFSDTETTCCRWYPINNHPGISHIMHSFSHCIFPIFPIFPNISQYFPIFPIFSNIHHMSLFYPSTFEEKPSLGWGNAPRPAKRSSRCPVGTRACDCSRCNLGSTLGRHVDTKWETVSLDVPIPKCCPFNVLSLCYLVVQRASCTHTPTRLCMYLCIYIYICVCVCVFACIFQCEKHMYIYIIM